MLLMRAFSAFLLIFLLSFPALAPGGGRAILTIHSGMADHRFTAELAETPEQQAHGLMFRDRLEDGHGMLFPLRPPRAQAMWMKNTRIPLDMIFIGPDGRIVRIEENTAPFSERVIDSGGPVAAVLEIAGGSAKQLGIRPGDKVEYADFSR